MMPLTERMKNWISELGVHIAVATTNGYPSVIIVPHCDVHDDRIEMSLTLEQATFIQDDIMHNPYAALAPAGLGSVRAPYQIKGAARLQGRKLNVTVEEIYCTKPGDEAGIRLDCRGFEAMAEFDADRWPDVHPPRPDGGN